MAVFDLETSSFDIVVERSVFGFVFIEPPMPRNAPVVRAAVGGALLRMMYEYGATGIAADALGTGYPNVNPGSAVAIRPILPPAFGYVFEAEGGNYSSLSADLDARNLAVVLFDPAFDSLNPTIALPTYKTWCEAFGGTYTQL